MKIVRFESFGIAHEVCACVDAPDPGPPAADEVVVDVDAFPINPVDLLTIAGTYAIRPDLPAVPGSEGVGRVADVGAEVTAVAPGDRVLLMSRENWAERKRLKSTEVLKVPGDLDVRQLAMLKINPATAALMLGTYVELKEGDWVIQNAANSGVGQNLIRLARARGIRTVNVVRRESLVGALKEMGADVVVVDGDNLAEHVRRETEDAAIPLAIDAVAGEATQRLSECLADGATIVNYGLLSGRPCMVPADRVIFKGLTLTGFWLVEHLGAMTGDERAAFYGDLAARIADGSLMVGVEAVYPIEDITGALEHARRKGRDGKILVAPGGPFGGGRPYPPAEPHNSLNVR